MTTIAGVEDLRCLARSRVPKMFYDYVDGGSWSESTYRANETALGNIRFRQRVGVNIEKRNLATELVGQRVAMPVALGPIGLCGMQHADGEILAARAAEAFGAPFCLSTMSICSIEDVAGSTTKPFWFQLYVMRDRQFVMRLIERARAAHCSALVVTLDLQIIGDRHKDARNGLSTPPQLTPRTAFDLATKPRWCLSMLQTSRRQFGNIIGHVAGVSDMRSLSAWTNSQFDPTMTWEDIVWIRQLWKGPLILKGIMEKQDAQRAVDVGADAIVVSNHGGRQLDGAPATIEVLPHIVESVGDRIEILFDGGVRSGQDVLRAVALGARGVLLGRAYVYGLGAMGQAGVSRCLSIIEQELSLTMGFCGRTDIENVGRDILFEAAVG
jgi:L-lactate dehydrogenase (cytochrome)